MKVLTEILLIWDQSTAYLTACWSLPMAAPACRVGWYWVAVGSMAGGALLVLWAVWRVIDYLLKHRAALRAQAARDALPDEETVQKHRWVGDDTAVAEPDDGMAAKIRAEIERRKLAEKGLVRPKSS